MTTDERWLDADEQAAWRGWLETYRLLIPVLDRQLQVSRVSFTEYEVLVCLSEATDQRLRMSEVADRTLATRSAITRTVDRLVARGWVRRVRSLQDQRGAYANLTESGANALAELAPGHVNAVRENLIDLLTAAELDALRSIGGRMRQRLAGRDGWSIRTPSAETDGADAGVVDAGVVDAGVVDAGVVDAGVVDAVDAEAIGSDPMESDPSGSEAAGPDTPGPETAGPRLVVTAATGQDEPVIVGPGR